MFGSFSKFSEVCQLSFSIFAKFLKVRKIRRIDGESRRWVYCKGPSGHIRMVPNGFLDAPGVKNMGKNAREQHFKLLKIYPPPCPPILVVLAAGGSIVQGPLADFCYDQMALNDCY